jgi:RimJ/RimL family protein N-acetyltransferase
MTRHNRMDRVDKLGQPFQVAECGSESEADLKEMYDGFHPRSISQGLPPAHDEELYRWISMLLARGDNFLAWQDGKVVGHASLLFDLDKKDGEYIIFVCQPYRNRGLGTILTAMTMDKARGRGLTNVWLTVEAYNFRAIRVYRNAGFKFIDEGELERTMSLDI